MDFADVITRPRIDGVVVRKMVDKDIFRGSLVITGHHLIFQSDGGASENPAWFLPHKSIDFVTTEPKTQMNSGGLLILKCKNFLIATIEFFTSYEDCLAVAKSVEILSNLADIKLHYPFFYQCPFRMYENGWESFNVEEDEFTRLQTQSDFWRVSHVNKNYVTCATYPEEVIVPKLISDDQLKASAQFRDGSRFPVLSYFHKETRAVVVKCSQPMVGNNRRCKEDEQLLNAMLNSSNRGYIIDTRAYNVALAAKSRGFGFEPEMHYSRWKRVHKVTPRWQQLQDSLVKLIEACIDNAISSDKWISKVNSSNWLQNVSDVLNCACVTAQCLDREEMSVIVHGSEGTDSTLMVASLVQIILDPDCRSIRGFESLIEREWVKGGHPFSSRCAHLAYGKSKNSSIPESPTFLLFLDCVWQIFQQFSCSFEFTEKFLIRLFDHAYASEFGTFLCNNEKEKEENDVKNKTISLCRLAPPYSLADPPQNSRMPHPFDPDLFSSITNLAFRSYINRPEILAQYLNPFFDPNKGALWPSIAPQSIELWQRMYCRWSRNWQTIDNELSTLMRLKEEEKNAYSQVVRLQRHLGALEKEAAKAGIQQ